jgi:EAL domain-containing protein (putative c-di-GMP-specific phosphodiesterase class I)
VEVGNTRINVSASIGISIFPDDADNSEELFKAADTAMYHAKSQGKDSYQFYSNDLISHITRKTEIENDLRGAIVRQEFELYYQPQISLTDGKVKGVEALIRWKHPNRGQLLPEEFIYIADECHLIDSITEWVLETALIDYQQWTLQNKNRPRISINITLRQISASKSLQHLIDIIERLNFAPNVLELELEITETALESFSRSAELIKRFKHNGVMFAVEDFGTGHSPLGHLKQLPIDTLKIGRGFINGLPDNSDDRVIVTAIIALAHSLELRVIAQGVETKQQLEMLRELDCDEIQGFYVSKPVPMAELNQLLDKVFEINVT